MEETTLDGVPSREDLLGPKASSRDNINEGLLWIRLDIQAFYIDNSPIDGCNWLYFLALVDAKKLFAGGCLFRSCQ